MTEQTFTGTLTGEDRARGHIVYVPFTVPPGTARIEVDYSFWGGNSILDLGLADPDFGPFPATEGFRGWSGSARRQAHVTATDATPGYIPGSLQPGRWQVLLGLARVSPQGCDYTVTVRTTPGRTGPDPVRRREERPVPAAPEWLPGDLQSHTHHSDARGSVMDLLQAARTRGLSFLAVTDHNTCSHHAELRELTSEELVLIPGTEVTTYRGHANVWGVNGFVDFRVRDDADLDQLVRQVHERGGLFSVNHPKVTPDCIGCDWEFAVPREADAFEAWQGPWAARNWESLARFDERLRSGQRLTLVGGSDRHQPPQPDTDPAVLQVGSPTTWLHASRSIEALLDALRAGKAFVSESPTGPRLEITAGAVAMGGAYSATSGKVRMRARVRGASGDRLAWVSAEGTVREADLTGDDFSDEFDWEISGPFIRAEIRAVRSLAGVKRELQRLLPAASAAEALLRPWRRALSNPVYFGPRD